jgi:acetylornithine deacetylase
VTAKTVISQSNSPARLAKRLDDALRDQEHALVDTLGKLVQTPSENLPPHGNEQTCQLQIAAWLRELEIEPDVYELAEVPELPRHAEYWPGRNYANRPNVNGILKGKGGGRSLILSGHIDTVPADTPVAWTHPPFGAVTEDGRLFGRGAWDMKAGVAMNLAVLRALRQAGIVLAGDLIFESVVDEEFGGVNGTLAGRLRGYNADAAIIGEPTALRICPAQRGGRTLHITLHGSGGILAGKQAGGRAVDQLTYVLSRLPELKERRTTRVGVHPYYTNSAEPFAVWVTNIATGKWGWIQPITVPEVCKMELYWQAMPDETQEEVEREFHDWWNEVVDARPDLFAVKPVIEWPMRFLPGCATPPDAPLVTEFATTAANLNMAAAIEGLDAPSDMYVFPRCFGTPAIMWGPSGGGAHQANEYVEVDSLVAATRALAHFVCRWCGAKDLDA